MQITLKVFRYNPEKTRSPITTDSRLKLTRTTEFWMCWSTSRAIMMAPFLSTFLRARHLRLGCHAHQRHNRLACKVLVKDLHSSRIVVEPIMGLPVVKDLIVDMEPFFEHYRSVMPFLVNDEPIPKQERLQSPEARERFDDTTKCILCACCTTSCPSFWARMNTWVQQRSWRHTASSSTTADRAGRAPAHPEQPVRGIPLPHDFNCTEACPREIQVTKAIGR